MEEFLKPLAKKRKLPELQQAVQASTQSSSSPSAGSSGERLNRELMERYAQDYHQPQAPTMEQEDDTAISSLSEKERLLRMMDRLVDEEDASSESVDAKGARRLIAQLDKAMRKNEEMRAKFADEPEKFLESEADLDEALNQLLRLAASPQFYQELVAFVPRLLTLLSHENTDISIATIQLLQELTDEDVLPENPGDYERALLGMQQLIRGLFSNQLLDLLVQNLSRLDESKADDEKGVFALLGVMENVISFDTSLAETIAQHQVFFPWLLERVARKPYDANKQYASELLAILVQSSPGNHQRLSESNGVDVILRVLAQYKRKDPKDADEQEFMENMFDALCSALTSPFIKEKFVDGEGVELMVLMLKEKRLSRLRALKVLAFSMAGLSRIGALECCERFVDNQGLKYLFSCFMKKYSKKLKKEYPNSFSDSDEDEHTMTILSSLFRHLTEDAPHFRFPRLVSKFEENDYEKTSRLVELHQQYSKKLARHEAQHTEEDEQDAPSDEEARKVERYLRRMDHGLATLQMVDFVLAELMTAPSSQLATKAQQMLMEAGNSLEEIQQVLVEYLENIGDSEQDVGITDREKMRITQLLDEIQLVGGQSAA